MCDEAKKNEIIVQIGAVGGFITVYRMQTDQGWHFTMEVDDWTPDLLDEEPMHEISAPVVAWDAAIKLLDEYPWPKLVPVFVHPDFQRQIWDVVQVRFSTLPGTAQRNWRRICGQN